MGNEVVKAGGGGALAGIAALKKNLMRVRANIQTGSGSEYLRFLTDGNWVHGKSNTEIVKGKARLAINPMQIKTGFTCWTDYDKKKNECLGEVLVPLGQTVDPLSLEDHSPWQWKPIMSFDLRIVGGKEDGKQLTWKPSSKGGLDMAGAIIDAIMVQMDEDEAHPVPVITLGSDFYEHSQWGRTYTPDFEIVAWLSMEGEAAAEEEEEEEEEEKPVRTRKPKPPVVEEEDEEDDEEEDEEEQDEPAAASPVRRRRR